MDQRAVRYRSPENIALRYTMACMHKDEIIAALCPYYTPTQTYGYRDGASWSHEEIRVEPETSEYGGNLS